MRYTHFKKDIHTIRFGILISNDNFLLYIYFNSEYKYNLYKMSYLLPIYSDVPQKYTCYQRKILKKV